MSKRLVIKLLFWGIFGFLVGFTPIVFYVVVGKSVLGIPPNQLYALISRSEANKVAWFILGLVYAFAFIIAALIENLISKNIK